MAIQKKWEELEIKDDFMFAKVMRDRDLCHEMLEKLLCFKISKIDYPEEQKTIDITYDSRSVRLDVYVEDEENTVYNVEIQTADTKELPKRSRYYQGMIDLNLIEKGSPYSSLNTSYVIFICTFDLFDQGYYQYTFRNCCAENPSIILQDHTTKIFFNTSGTKGDISEETKAFLRYVGGIPSENAFVKKLQDKVNKIRSNEEWRREYMTLFMRDQENRELGRQEGKAEGRKEGIQEEKKRMVLSLLKKNILSDEEIASVAEISLDELQEIKEMV